LQTLALFEHTSTNRVVLREHRAVLHSTPVPRYFLYGEPLRDVETDFLHVERIATRSRIHDWTIRPHAHPDQHQLLLLTAGAAEVRIEADTWRVVPIALVAVPAMAVHAFTFQPESDGFVVTIADEFVRRACGDDPDLEGVLSRGGCLDGPALAIHAPRECFEALEREFVWSARGRRTAILAHIQRLLVALSRLDGASEATSTPTRDVELVRRYREVVEDCFRHAPGLDELAGDLGVTPSRLNRACRAVASRTAVAILHERIMIEAKRGLLYTGMRVSEVARSVGFDDPAYFSRFFAARAGCSPSEFRQSTGVGEAQGVDRAPAARSQGS
jgi:AraC family transcriptional activator of pobA